MMAMAVSCDQMINKYGRGGDNACQYVKEQVPGLREDIASVEVIGEDSLLSDIGLIFGSTMLAKSSAEFQEGTLSKDKFKAIIDSLAHDATDVEYSWRFSNVINVFSSDLFILPSMTSICCSPLSPSSSSFSSAIILMLPSDSSTA